MNLLKLFKTKALTQVVYDDKGLPVDVRGLKCRGKPFTDSAEYYIQDDLDKRWHYLGNGVYWSIKGSVRTDTDNPYWEDKFLRQCEAWQNISL